jgi:predicted transcriptional regulator
MRVHVHLDDEIVDRLDARAGERGRSRFVEAAVRQALDDADAWDMMRSALGTIDDEGHPWDADPAGWVSDQRHADASRVG